MSELARSFGRGLEERFDFALFAAGHDTGRKGARAPFPGRVAGRKLGRQLLVNRDVV